MGSNTFGVNRSPSGVLSPEYKDNYKKLPSYDDFNVPDFVYGLKKNATFPGGEYGSWPEPKKLIEYTDTNTDLLMEDINLEGNPVKQAQQKPDLGKQTVLSGVDSFKTKQEEPVRDTSITGYMERAEQDRKRAEQARDAYTLVKAGAGIANAISKYNQTEAVNAYNINQANLQIMQTISDSRYEILKQQTKGKAAGDQALLSAVSRGQAATGDLAKTAISKEEVYAAQNMMITDINAMREVYNIKSKINQIEYSTEIARIQRNQEIVDNALTGAIAFM